MSDPTLSYPSATNGGRTGLQNGAWITLLVMGIMYCLGAGCIGIFGLFLKEALAARGRRPLPADTQELFTIFVVVASILSLINGAAYIWSSLYVRRGSRVAAITGIVFASLNVLLILAICVIGVIGVVTGRNSANPSSAILGLLFYGVVGICNGALIWLLGAWLRQRQHSAAA